MEKNFKAADLIGKEIIMGTTGAKYVVKSVDEDKLICDFENPTQGMSSKNMPVPFANVQKFIAGGKWTVADANEAATTDVQTEADVAEVDDIVPVVSKPVETTTKDNDKNDNGKATVEPIKPKKQQPKAKTQPSAISPQTSKGKLTYETYQNKKGKTCAKIIGFKETDKAYVNAAELHGSASWINTKDGKVLYLLFGHRYVEAARLVCEALNAGKSFAECKAIVDSKPKAETQTSAVSPQTSKGYSSEDVADMLKKIMAGGDVPEDIKKLLQAA